MKRLLYFVFYVLLLLNLGCVASSDRTISDDMQVTHADSGADIPNEDVQMLMDQY
jgi:hypothetical protein